jgi:adenylosuccinate lyase
LIDRYSREEISAVWSAENRYHKWLEIEILVCEALAQKGEIPFSALENIKAKAGFDVGKIDEIEKTTKHDVIAFLTDVSQRVGEDGRFLHLGLTSSDILDTSLGLLLREAADILLADLERLLAALKKKAFQYRDTIMIGRTHGIHAEPITFGLKMGLWYQEMARNRRRLLQAKETISTGKISGAVGTFSFVDPAVEEYVCRKLGLQPNTLQPWLLSLLP